MIKKLLLYRIGKYMQNWKTNCVRFFDMLF